jgi:gliding motility-associated-like protein
MIRYLFILLVISFFSISGRAQSVNTAYLCLGNGDIVLADLGNCSTTLVARLRNTSMFDIAQGDTDDTLYGIKNEDLYRIDLISGNFTYLGSLNVLGFGGNFRVTSLVKESNGVLLGVNQSSAGQLFRIDVNALTAINLGNTGFESAGDLTYFQGNLYLSADNDELILVDVQNPGNSSFVGSLASTGISNIFGVVTIITADPCAASPTFALVATGSRSTSFVDPITGATTANCNNLTNESIFGAAEVSSDIICSIDLELEGDGLANPSFCGSGSPTLTTIVDPSAPIGTYTYEWTVQGNPAILSTSPTYNPTVTNTTEFECLVTDTGRAAPDNTASSRITVTIFPEAVWNPIGPIIANSFYDLPIITGSNIPSNAAYFTQSGGAGTRYAEGYQISSTTFSSNPTTIYLYGIDQNGCELEEEFTLEFITAQVEISPSGAITGCEGDQITLTAIPDPLNPYDNYTYNWDDGLGGSLSSTASITVTLTQSTTFSVTVNDSGVENGFGMGFDMVMVAVTPAIDLDDLSDQNAQNEFTFPSITGSNVTAGANYYTQPGGQGTAYNSGDVVDPSDFTSLPVTLYIYDSSGGCSDEESFVLDIIPTSFNATLTTSSSAVCEGENVTLTAITSPAAAVGNYSYEWNTASNATVLSTNASFAIAVNTTTTFNCTITDSGITGSDGVIVEQITVTASPAIILDARSNVNVNNTYTFPPITGMNLSGNEAYFTAPNGGGSRYEAGDIVLILDFANFPVTIYIFDSNFSCEATETYELVIDPVILTVNINASDTIICEGESITLTATVDPSTPINSYTYEWTSSTTGMIVGTSNPISITPTASTTITCTVTDLGIVGSANIASNTVNIQVSPQVIINTPMDVAADLFYTFPAITGINVSTDAAYFTQPNGTGTRYEPGDTVSIADFANLPVTIFIYDINGSCDDETSFELDINLPVLSLNITATDDEICLGENTTLTATPSPTDAVGTYSYEWRIAGSTTILENENTIVVDPLVDTVYECTVVDNGLPSGFDTAISTISIQILNTPFIEPINDQVVETAFMFPEIIGNNLSGIERYYFQAGGVGLSFEEGQILEYDEMVNYPLEVFIYDENSNGCSDEVSFLLTIIEPVAELFKIPQFLTPNDDNFNDRWNVTILDPEVIMDHIYIYDRYGKLLEQISVTGTGWDGSFNDNPLPSSSYWFQFEYNYRGVPSERKGYFALKR